MSLLQKYNLANLSEKPLLILCEQTWGIDDKEYPRSALQGIEVAQYLRRVMKVKNPIIFASFLPPHQLLKRKGTSIITAIGHGFVQIPYTDEELQKEITRTQTLTDIQLRDVIRNFCGERGILSNAFHGFKGRVRTVANNSGIDSAEKAKLIRQQFKSFEDELRKEYVGNIDLFAEFIKLTKHFQDEQPDESIKKITEVNDNYFFRFLPNEEDTDELITRSATPWKILLLDDEPESIQPVVDEFTRRGILCDVMKTVAESQQVIENDKDNTYTVIISDYRLLEGASEHWPKPRLQPQQGYDFLVWLAKQYRFNAMIALSGLGRQFLMESFRLQQTNVKVYSKNELDRSLKLFADDIEYLGDLYFDMVCSQPNQKDWKETLPYYKTLRNQVDYYSIEEEISRRAKTAARDVYGQITLTEQDLELLSLTSEFGDAQQSIKGKDDTEEDTVKKLITKLVLRRIALYCLCKGISAENTAKLLMYGNTLAAITDSNKKQTISKLHLQTDTDIPYHILTEERTWLEKDMGIPVFAMRQTLDVTIDIVNQIINKPENKKKLKSLQSELPIDSIGNISALSVQELKVVVNKILKVINLTGDGKELRDELWNTAVKLTELLPGMKHPEELKKLIEDYERKGGNNDLRN